MSDDSENKGVQPYNCNEEQNNVTTTPPTTREQELRDEIILLATMHYSATKNGLYNAAQLALVLLRAAVEELQRLTVPTVVTL